MTTSLQVAETIRHQIGHQAFVMMGAKHLSGDEKSLQFRIGRNEKGVTHIRVSLASNDLYKVEFFRVRGIDAKTLATEEGLYAEDLLRSFERNTGLYTRI